MVDSKDFLETFLYESPEKYDISELKRSKDKLVGIFENSIEIIRKNDTFLELYKELLSSENLYDVIYNRQSQGSLTSAFDMSLHLVTRNKNYPTTKQNLNFVFADEEVWNDYWEEYYRKIPYILFYIVEIAVLLFEKYLDVDKNTIMLNRYMRQLKILRVLSTDTLRGVVDQAMEYIFSECNFHCENCDNKYEKNSNYLQELKQDYLMSCQSCNFVEHLGQYFLDKSLLTKTKKIFIDNSSEEWIIVDRKWE